ncbi:MAG: tetratricopeptide repeat protein [Bernardetiaceae bacterium]
MRLAAIRHFLLAPSVGLLHRRAFQAFLITTLSFVLYLHTFTHDYALGDQMVFTENEYALRGLNGISDILIHDSFKGFLRQHQEIRAGGQYRPFSIITFAIEYEFFGVNPMVSHAINTIIYSLTCLLLLFTLHQMFGNHRLPDFLRSIMPFMATVLFVVHPIHTDIVANVQQRDDLLAFFFLLITTYLVLLGTQRSFTFKLLLLPPILLSFGCALISNEISVSFLVIIPLILYCFSDLKKRELLVLAVPFWITALVFVKAQEFFALEAVQLNDLLNNPFLHATNAEKYATLIYVAGRYLKILIFPFQLSHDYSYNEIPLRQFSDPAVWGILLFYGLGLIAATISMLRRRNVVSFAFLYFVLSLGTISTVSNLIFPTGVVMDENLLYIPSLGICIGFVYFVYYVATYFSRLYYAQRYSIYTLIWAISLIVMTFFAIKTVQRSKVWENNFTLLLEDVKYAPNSAKIRNMLAEEYLHRAANIKNTEERLHLINEGVSHLKRGIEIYPDNAAAWVLLGNTEMALYDHYKADACYKKAIEIDPTTAEAYRNLALIALKRGNYVESIDYTQQWIVNQKKYRTVTKRERSVAFQQLGDLYAKIDSLDFSILAYNTAIDFDKTNVSAYVGLGLVSERKSGSMSMAIENFRTALSFDPENTYILEHLSMALARKGDYEGGIKNLKKAIRMDAQNPTLYESLAMIYEEMGEIELAQSYYRKAGTLNKGS